MAFSRISRYCLYTWIWISGGKYFATWPQCSRTFQTLPDPSNTPAVVRTHLQECVRWTCLTFYPQPSWTLGNIFWRIFLSFGMFCSVAKNLSLLKQYLWHKPTLKYVMQKQSLSFSMLFLTTGSLYCFYFQTQCQPDLFWSWIPFWFHSTIFHNHRQKYEVHCFFWNH